MKKCDIIIPVYKAPEWVKLCIYALFQNTKKGDINKVYLINDCDDEYTINCLHNLAKKYPEIIFLQNEKNMGFIKTVNKGLSLSKADYVLLLNTDCLVSENTIGKLMEHMKRDKNIGLLCPISSNAANLTLDMYPGFNYSMMNQLLEEKFKGQIFDACTVVGNCLMISRECIEKVGYLDEAYGMGYGEETDYQFKAMENGFMAKVAIDTYVFHKSEVSFGVSKEKKEKLNNNRQLFFSRWGKAYNIEMKKYKKNDPIKYIQNHITAQDKQINLDYAFYLNGILQNAGGVHIVIDLVNYLSIHNQNVSVIYDVMGEYKEIMLFHPVSSNAISNDFSCKELISTIWLSTIVAYELAKNWNCKLTNFVQGYETYFENGANYGSVELSYKLPDRILVISNYLKDELKNTFNQKSYVISNSIPYDILATTNHHKKASIITMILRNNCMKGDWLCLDILKKLDQHNSSIHVNLIYMNEHLVFPQFKNIKVNKILGPLERQEIYKLLQKSDIYVDCSLSEGFGLTALEALTAGCVPVTSDSKGINEYMQDGKNGFIIKEVNDSQKYVEAIEKLMKNHKTFQKMLEENKKIVLEFDSDKKIKDYIAFFQNQNGYNKKISLTLEEEEMIQTVMESFNKSKKSKSLIYKFARKLPKGLKRRIKKVINLLKQCY